MTTGERIDPLTGRTIAGRYRIVAPIGQGGYGVVYKVEDQRRDGVLLALKLLIPPDEQVQSKARERFIQEAQLLAKLRHPGIPRVWDIGDEEGVGPFMVSDFVDGVRLLDQMDCTMELKARLEAAGEFLEALGAVHEAGILHRDLKPHNILVPRDGSGIKVIDFGIAKSVDGGGVSTQNGIILGTPEFLAPEQLLGRDYTVQSDLFQAGLVVFTLMTGASAFPKVTTLVDHLDNLRRGPDLGPIEMWPWYGKVATSLRPALLCLAADPDERPRSAGEVREGILRARAVVTKEPMSSVAGAGGRAAGVAAANTVAGVVPSRDGKGATVAVPRVQSEGRGKSSGRDATVGFVVDGARGGGQSGSDERRPGTDRGGSRRWVPVGLGLVVAVAILQGLYGRFEHAHAAITPTPSLMESPAMSPRKLADRLTECLSRRVQDLSLLWLQRFASARLKYLKKDPVRVGEELKSHFHDIGLLESLEAFLRRSREYFADEGIPEEERWATRSALCDVELVEYFCAEQRVPWVLGAKVSNCAGKWDEPVQPWNFDFSHARSWVRCASSEANRCFINSTWFEVWDVDRPRAGELALLWFALMRWQPGLVIEAEVGDHVRRLVRFSKSPSDPGSIKLSTESYITETGATIQHASFALLSESNRMGQRGYMGVWVSSSLIGPATQVRLRMIDLPQSTSSFDPELTTRILSLVKTQDLPAK